MDQRTLFGKTAINVGPNSDALSSNTTPPASCCKLKNCLSGSYHLSAVMSTTSTTLFDIINEHFGRGKKDFT